MRHSPRRKLQRMTWSSCSREHRAWPGARCGGYAADHQLADAQSCHLRHGSCRLDHETGQGAAPRLPRPRHCECRDQGRQRREFSATMGSMSASDAAPLPRLGEVFFDVRGDSRSMRLSWYADTGVAVFSIWQGGTCTGTFRLPIEDLPRMTEALQRGPRGAGQPATDVPSLTGLPGGRRGQSGDMSAAPFAEYATGQHIAPVTGEFRCPELEERATDPFGSGGYRAASPDPVYPPP